MNKYEKLLETKKKGDKWFTVNAPEELRYWHNTKQWPLDAFREYGVAFIEMEVQSSKAIAKADTTEYSKKKPLVLKSGTVITDGFTTITSQNLTGRYPLISKTVGTLNGDLEELTHKHRNVKNWRVHKLTVYNSKTGYTLYFEYFDPNQTGKVLALWAVENIDGKMDFSQISDMSTLDKAVGGFKEKLISCIANVTSVEVVSAECNIISPEQLKDILKKEKIIKTKGPVTVKKVPKKAPATKLRKGAANKGK